MNQEIFAMYTNALNQQAANTQQQTAALQQAFMMMMQQQGQQMQQPIVQQPVMQQPTYQQPIMEQPVVQTPTQPMSAPLVEETYIQDPGFIAPNEQFRLNIRAMKKCEDCPFAASCDNKFKESLQFKKECNLDGAKAAALTDGEVIVKPQVQGSQLFFPVFKDGELIGEVFQERENKTALSADALGAPQYMGKSIRVLLTLVRPREGCILTHTNAEILGVVENTVPVSVPSAIPVLTDMDVPPIPEEIHQEESSIFLGDFVMSSF